MRDLDVGRQLVRYLDEFDWPEGVVIEDLSYAAPLVLHRLQELDPAKVVLVGATARFAVRPGTVRRCPLDAFPPGSEEVKRCLEEAVGGVADLDHTVAVARHWGCLPDDTVVIEVEPADCSFGVGFSDEMAASFDPILDMVRDELNCTDASRRGLDFDADLAGEPDLDSDAAPSAVAVEPSEGLRELADYADEHKHVRVLQAHRGKLLHTSLYRSGVMLAERSRPWGVQLDNGGDWSDVIPLDDGWFGVVMGDAAGRGLEAAGEMADLRAAVRAYAMVEGKSPSRLLAHLDGLARVTGVGDRATLVYAALHATTGELRYSNAGQCPPLVLSRGDGRGEFLADARSDPLGGGLDRKRSEATFILAPNATLLLFTDGLVGHPGSVVEGLERIRRAAGDGPWPLNDLCDHLLDTCENDLGRSDDVCLLGLRLRPDSGSGLRAAS